MKAYLWLKWVGLALNLPAIVSNAVVGTLVLSQNTQHNLILGGLAFSNAILNTISTSLNVQRDKEAHLDCAKEYDHIVRDIALQIATSDVEDSRYASLTEYVKIMSEKLHEIKTKSPPLPCCA